MLADQFVTQSLHTKAARATQIEDEDFRFNADFARGAPQWSPALFNEPGLAGRLITPPPFPQRWA